MDGWVREVLTDEDLSVKIRVLFEDGAELPTRGIVAYAPPSDTLALADDRLTEWNAWIPTPENRSRASRIFVTPGDDPTLVDEYVVLYPARTAGAHYTAVAHDTTRYQLCLVEVAEAVMVDFDPADFSAVDFG